MQLYDTESEVKAMLKYSFFATIYIREVPLLLLRTPNTFVICGEKNNPLYIK